MYLKRLEMENFKSFSGEITIPFERGFTAITGPNGSGKSNCGDAIQFVLGYKSAKDVRASNVKDLIFNGGKNDRPAKHCSVALVFDNPEDATGSRRLNVDADEVHFSRRVRITRSGNADSSYHLNGEASTQRQFKLLLSSANARADGYNIVLQGMVTELATMTPKSRRKVLEEVAGVRSYDEEIRKAERQRARVEEYLERIELLEEELKMRLKDLKSERAQALRYQTLKEELDSARVRLHQARHNSAVAEIDYVANEQSNCLIEAKESGEKAQAAEKLLLELDEQIAGIERELRELLGDDSTSLMERLNALRLDIDRRGDWISEAAQTIEENTENIEFSDGEFDEAKDALDQHLSKQADAKRSLEQARSSFEQAEREEAEAKEALLAGDKQTNSLTRALSKATSAVSEAAANRSVVQLEADRASQAHDLALANLSLKEEQMDECQLVRDDLLLTGEDLRSSEAGEDRESIAAELVQRQREAQKLQEEADAINNRLLTTERELVKARGEMESRSGVRGGMAMAVSTILSRRDSGEQRGILGTISELAGPKDSAHEEALATAIGAGMQSIVVEDDKTAAECIAWLRQNKAGRATFLPLNKLQVGRPGGKALMIAKEADVEGFAWELLDHDPRIELAVRYVLRDTLVVANLATARKHMGGVRMVTLRGDITEAGGAMIGGNRGRNRILFGGQLAGSGEVERLEVELGRLGLLADTVNSALRESRQLQQNLQQRISELTSSDDISLAKQWSLELQNAEELLKRAVNAVSEAKSSAEQTEKLLAAARTVLDAALAACAQAEQARLSATEALQEASPEHLQVQLRQIQQLRVDAGALQARAEAQLSGGVEHTDILEDRLAELRQRIERLQQDSESKQQSRKSWKKEQSVLKAELKELEAQHTTITEEQKALDDSRVRLVEERGSLRTGVQQLVQQADSARRRAQEHSITLDQKRELLAELNREMASAGIEPAQPGEEIPTVQKAETAIRSIERRLESIGNVNMLSIEQYDRTAERVGDLQSDNKLCDSRRKSLIQIAEKLEKQRKKRLIAVFKEVNKNFKGVYRLLSDGGRGELRLENPDDPFAGGLEMWCQPKGKSARCKLRELSGGEKSMAALSLIFAVQDHDPSPFYYFDEVDQNLDAFNAERIARLCRARASSAQFIMVTLRKVSLQIADHHIGITHAGDGCSRRIADFDRDRAIALGAKAEEELALANEKAAELQQRLGDLPSEADMPKVPDPISSPPSLGGLSVEAEGEVPTSEVESQQENVDSEDSSLVALSDRAEDAKADIDEHQEWKAALKASEDSEQDPRADAIEITDETEEP